MTHKASTKNYLVTLPFTRTAIKRPKNAFLWRQTSSFRDLVFTYGDRILQVEGLFHVVGTNTAQ